LEENPWDVYETTYTLGSVHNGVINNFVDKGATVTLQEGVEGFVSLKNLAKQDGTSANVGETLAFKVIEFNKSNKKISLSHVRTWEEPAPRETKERNSEADATQKAVKKLKANLEKTTLGDISELAALKAELENAQNK
jgi:small subunit ribosomal protein S1